MLPAVSTSPMSPDWSPDGKWIAFSMRGDIWKMPGDGGDAIALTQGPNYYFEPSWSPDGKKLAATVDVEGNLDIAVVDADGQNFHRITEDAHIDVQPVWSPTGDGVYFISARNGSFDVYFKNIETGELQTIVEGRGHQIQPAVSPDGKNLAYISPVRGRLGTGGIWVKELPDGESKLVHYEETSFRTKPKWTPDGSAIIFVSDEAGSNDIAAIPENGGSKVRLTEDQFGEYNPAVHPSGKKIVFTSNQTGPTQLFTMPWGGARRQGWQAVKIDHFQAKTPTGFVAVKVVDEDGQTIPARIYLQAGNGRSYAPGGAFHRIISATETHYFHTDGEFVLEAPVGEMKIEAMRGFEYIPESGATNISADDTAQVRLVLKRLIDAPAKGWFSGETHGHDLHQGRFGLSHEDYFAQLVAEDLHMTNALIHMDGTRIMGRWDDLTGSPSPLSTKTHILQYAQEFRGSFGHVGLLGIKEFIMPLIGGTTGTAFEYDVLNFEYLDQAKKQGGVGGFMHPYSRAVAKPEEGAYSEIALDVALGKGDFFDVLCIWYDEIGNAEMYYRFLNAGFRLAATGGSDSFADVSRDPPPGTTRTYAKLDGALSVKNWLEGVRQGKTFGTSGPLLFLTVDDKDPGAEIAVADDGKTRFDVKIDVVSIAPIDRVELIVNGEVAHTFNVRDRGTQFELQKQLELKTSGWIAARAIGPSHRYVTDSYAFAQTSPVYVVRGGKTFRDPEDAEFLAKMVEALWRRVSQRNRWPSESAKNAYRDAVEKAIGIYRNSVK